MGNKFVTDRRTHRPILAALCLGTVLALPGCVYRVEIQQGNLLDAGQVEVISPGMTRSQVRFLLGTPMVRDPFHHDRWDYVYYLDPGRKGEVQRRWLIVRFDGDTVRDVQRDVPLKPGG